MELSSGPSSHQPHESLSNFTNLLEPLLISKMEDHGHSMGADSKCETCRKALLTSDPWTGLGFGKFWFLTLAACAQG